MSIQITLSKRIITKKVGNPLTWLPQECHYCHHDITAYPYYSKHGMARGTVRKCYHIQCARQVGLL